MKFSSCRARLTGYARSCETVPIYSPTNLSRMQRPARREQQKSAKARKSCRSPAESGPGTSDEAPRSPDRSFGSPAPKSPSRHRDWATLPDARKDGTMQNPTEIVTIARSLSGVTAKSGMRSHYFPSLPRAARILPATPVETCVASLIRVSGG